ncbi:MAG: hypothetical protein J2P21_06910 [Chloracidobacterium sp.]|nr:hypothetical protein [Chloracidobacterium sp.]
MGQTEHGCADSSGLCMAGGSSRQSIRLLELSQVSTFGVEKFKKEELQRKTKHGKPPTPGTVNGCLVVLGFILTLAEELGLIANKQRLKIAMLKTDNNDYGISHPTRSGDCLLPPPAGRICKT